MFSTSRIAIAAALIANTFAVHAAKIEVAGNVTLNAKLYNSPVGSTAMGPGAQAHAAVNVLDGNVTVGGNLVLTADLHNSPVIALAFGPMAKATARVNALVN